MSRTKLLLDLVDCLHNLTDTLEEIAAVLAGNDIRAEPDEYIDPVTGEIISVDAIRRTAQEIAAQPDGPARLKALLHQYGAARISDLPESYYPSFWERLSTLDKEPHEP